MEDSRERARIENGAMHPARCERKPRCESQTSSIHFIVAENGRGGILEVHRESARELGRGERRLLQGLQRLEIETDYPHRARTFKHQSWRTPRGRAENQEDQSTSQQESKLDQETSVGTVVKLTSPLKGLRTRSKSCFSP